MARDFETANSDTFNFPLTLASSSTTGISGDSANSFHCFFNMESGGAQRRIFSIETSSNGRTGVFLGPTGADVIMCGGRSQGGDVSFQNAQGSTTLSTGTDYAVGGVLDWGNGDIFVYLNGSQDGSNTSASWGSSTYNGGTPYLNYNPSMGGRAGFGTEYLDGVVSEFAIWNVKLDAAEFAALADGVSPLLVRPGSLVAYWPMLENSGNIQDWVNNNTGTETGGTIATAAHPPVIYPSSQIIPFPTGATIGNTFYVNGRLYGEDSTQPTVYVNGRLVSGAPSPVTQTPPGPSGVVPLGHHRLDNQYAAIAASRLNGVLQ